MSNSPLSLSPSVRIPPLSTVLQAIDQRKRRTEQERLDLARQQAERDGTDASRQLLGIPTAGFERTEKQTLQAEAVAGDARHILAYGGARSGKTLGFCELIAERALQ